MYCIDVVELVKIGDCIFVEIGKDLYVEEYVEIVVVVFGYRFGEVFLVDFLDVIL